MTGKILIADDEPHIRRLIEQSLDELEDEGVVIESAADGAAALEIVEREHPDVVILDVMMPEMSGFEVCERIRQFSGPGAPYVLLLTAKGQEYDRRRGESAGADRYMTKPFSPDALLAIVREALDHRRR
ncbi:MAG TPA: response regulator [Rhodocyclaceae bacterium]|nr:response regulator [Rhodocyclaceae bacterium]HRQ48359.1 response regulator [Rhodocyclaceae bacterium]